MPRKFGNAPIGGDSQSWQLPGIPRVYMAMLLQLFALFTEFALFKVFPAGEVQCICVTVAMVPASEQFLFKWIRNSNFQLK